MISFYRGIGGIHKFTSFKWFLKEHTQIYTWDEFFIWNQLWDFCGSSDGKESTCNVENWDQSLHWEDPLEEGMATHSSSLAWKISIDGGAWRATVQGVKKNWTWLSNQAQHTGDFPAVQWLRLPSNAGAVGSIPGQGTKFPHDMGHGQKFLKIYIYKNYEVYRVQLYDPC